MQKLMFVFVGVSCSACVGFSSTGLKSGQVTPLFKTHEGLAASESIARETAFLKAVYETCEECCLSAISFASDDYKSCKIGECNLRCACKRKLVSSR